jgi:hypothetical protein
MVGQPSRAIVIDKNRHTARRFGRVLGSAGYAVDLVDPQEGAPLPSLASLPAGQAVLLVAEAASREVVFQMLAQGRDGCAGILQGPADEFDGNEMLAGTGLLALLGSGQRGAGPMDLEAELLSVARHHLGLPLPPLQAHLLWGAQAYGADIANVAARDAATARIVELCNEKLATSRRTADSAGEVVHELLTNAMYAAPVDEKGKVRYAEDRTASLELPPSERVGFSYGTDGLRLAVEVVDRFGLLCRADLVKSLRRGASGQIKRGGGGAGIGLSVVFRACQTLQIDVVPGKRTRVTAVLDIEPRQKDAGPTCHSLIFSSLEASPGPGHRPGPTAPALPEGEPAP